MLPVASTRMPGMLRVVVAVVALPSCGHRATQADCQLIVDKAVDLQLKEIDLHDAPSIEKHEEQVRAELGSEIKACEGRHVTERTLACVRAATSTLGLDACLR